MRPLVAASLGAAVAIVLLWASGRRAPSPVTEDGAPIAEIVVQYGGPAGFDVLPVYAALFDRLRRNVRVLVAVPDEATLAALARAVDRPLVPVVVGRPITSWAKDRFVPVRDGARTLLLVPENPVEGSAQRRNDWEVPFALARAFPDRFAVVRLPLDFDGGDLLATADEVIASDALLAKNAISEAELRRILEPALGRPLVLLRRAPDHHIGMYLMAAGPRRFVFGRPDPRDPRFEAVREQLLARGYELVEAPLVLIGPARVWITYANAVVDGPRVYVPEYGREALDAAGRAAWEHAGFEVVPIPVGELYRAGGTIHCLVNVLARR